MASVGRLGHDFNQALHDLIRARDELYLKAHLLSLDARRRFAKLELDIDQLQDKLTGRTEDVAERLASTANGLTSALKQLLQGADQPTRARDVMTPGPATCRPWETLSRAAQLMWDHDCGIVPVTDEAERLVGVVTDRDVCMATCTRGERPSSISVESVMASSPAACSPSTSLRNVMNTMVSKQVRRLPVVEDGRLVGIVSLADLARLAKAPSVRSREVRHWLPVVLASLCRPRITSAAARSTSTTGGTS